MFKLDKNKKFTNLTNNVQTYFPRTATDGSYFVGCTLGAGFISGVNYAYNVFPAKEFLSPVHVGCYFLIFASGVFAHRAYENMKLEKPRWEALVRAEESKKVNDNLVTKEQLDEKRKHDDLMRYFNRTQEIFDQDKFVFNNETSAEEQGYQKVLKNEN